MGYEWHNCASANKKHALIKSRRDKITKVQPEQDRERFLCNDSFA
jgi:hypothetical protein